MRHYEVVFLIHPDRADQAAAMKEKYKKMITEEKAGTIHRFEEWGRRPLAYAIQNVRKAYYFLMNIEVSQEIIDEMVDNFRFNDAVLRFMLIRRNGPISEPSLMINQSGSERREFTKETVDEPLLESEA